MTRLSTLLPVVTRAGEGHKFVTNENGRLFNLPQIIEFW